MSDGHIFCMEDGNANVAAMTERFLEASRAIARGVLRFDIGFWHVYRQGAVRRVWPRGEKLRPLFGGASGALRNRVACGSNRAVRLAAGAQIVSVLTGVPALFLDRPALNKLLLAILLGATLTAVVLHWFLGS